jgi:hypothetical protein
LLDEGYYAAAIARRLHISRAYVSRFIKELQFKGLITLEWINPLQGKAASYRLSPELEKHVIRTQLSKPDITLTLAIPHYVRYKFPFTTTKPISLKTKRFAASKLKLEKEWCMIGGKRYVFKMKHDTIGDVGVVVHPHSIVVSQRDRHPIISKSTEDATNIVAMALSDVANRFVQEQGWENIDITLGQPKLVGSPHYAFPSKIAKKVVEAGNTLLQVGGGLGIDDSPKAKGIKGVSDIETDDAQQADMVDRGLRVAANLEEVLPTLVKNELKSVIDEIQGIKGKADKIDGLCNNVAALCQSGTPLNQQVSMHQTIVARQGESINLIQQSMLKLIENMGKIIDNIGVK